MRNTFFKNYAENRVGRLVLFLFSKNASYKVKAMYNTIKINLYNIWDCWSRDILNLIFLLAFPLHFLCNFSRKIFPISYVISEKLTNLIVWLLLLLEILGNMCVVAACCVCDVINFEINHSIYIKSFFYITKKSEQKCKY